MNNATFKTAIAASMLATAALALSIPDYDESFCNSMEEAISVFGCGTPTRCKTILTYTELSQSNLSY